MVSKPNGVKKDAMWSDAEQELIDYFCGLDLETNEIRRHPKSRCGLYKDVETRAQVHSYMVRLAQKYPDLKHGIWSVAPTAWARVMRVSDRTAQAKVLKLIVEFMKTGDLPFDRPPRHRFRTLTDDDVWELIRYANGLPPSGRVKRGITFWPKDVADLKAVFLIAQQVKKQQGKEGEVDRILALQAKLLGPIH